MGMHWAERDLYLCIPIGVSVGASCLHTLAAGRGGWMAIASVGHYLKGHGLDIGEHPDFGGVGGAHAPNSYHYYGEAIDVRDWRPDVAPEYEGGQPLHWKERTRNLVRRARELGFTEALGPGDRGHDTHAHLALRGKRAFTESELDYLGTGRFRLGDGYSTDVRQLKGAGGAIYEPFGGASDATSRSSASAQMQATDTQARETQGVDSALSQIQRHGQELLKRVSNGGSGGLGAGPQPMNALQLLGAGQRLSIGGPAQASAALLAVLGSPRPERRSDDRGALSGVRVAPLSKPAPAPARERGLERSWRALESLWQEEWS